MTGYLNIYGSGLEWPGVRNSVVRAIRVNFFLSELRFCSCRDRSNEAVIEAGVAGNDPESAIRPMPDHEAASDRLRERGLERRLEGGPLTIWVWRRNGRRHGRALPGEGEWSVGEGGAWRRFAMRDTMREGTMPKQGAMARSAKRGTASRNRRIHLWPWIGDGSIPRRCEAPGRSVERHGRGRERERRRRHGAEPRSASGHGRAGGTMAMGGSEAA